MKIRNMTFFQKPNLPLLLAAALWLMARISHGTLKEYLSLLFIAVMLWWSYLEITSGVNIFRKLLGLVVGLMMISNAYRIVIL